MLAVDSYIQIGDLNARQVKRKTRKRQIERWAKIASSVAAAAYALFLARGRGPNWLSWSARRQNCRGKVLTHRFLLNELWDELPDAQYLRVYVRQLRQKIEADPEWPQFVLTETGIGYRLRAAD